MFRAQLDLLLAAGFKIVTVAEFAERPASGPPPGLVALSFDDGMDDNHSVVFRSCGEYGLRATVYVTTGLIGSRTLDGRARSGARMMTVDELRDLVAAGWEIGAHTVSASGPIELDFESCLREMSESRYELERLLDVRVETFACSSCHYSPTAVTAAREAGFARR